MTINDDVEFQLGRQEGSRERIETYWDWWYPPNIDRLELYVRQYRWEPQSEHPKSFYLNLDGQWEEFPEAGRMSPCLTIPGTLIHNVMKGFPAYNEEFKDMVMRKFTEFMSLLTSAEKDETPSN